MKLGQGWNPLGAGVWEHPSGMRANSVIARMPDGTIVQRIYDEKNFNRFVAINGGNVRRGMLAWANQQLAKWTAEQAEQQSHILMSDLTQTLSTGTALWNNRRRKVYYVAGQVSPCEINDWQILYYEVGLTPNNDIFRRRSASEFFELNRDGLPRFIVLPSNPALWSEYIRGYLIGLSRVDSEPMSQGSPDFLAVVILGQNHAYAAFELRMQRS